MNKILYSLILFCQTYAIYCGQEAPQTVLFYPVAFHSAWDKAIDPLNTQNLYACTNLQSDVLLQENNRLHYEIRCLTALLARFRREDRIQQAIQFGQPISVISLLSSISE